MTKIPQKMTKNILKPKKDQNTPKNKKKKDQNTPKNDQKYPKTQKRPKYPQKLKKK